MSSNPFDSVATTIKKMVRYEIGRTRSGICFGTVKEIEDNGAIYVETFDGMVLGGAQLVLSMFCQERTIHLPYDESADDDENMDSHIHEMNDALGKISFDISVDVSSSQIHAVDTPSGLDVAAGTIASSLSVTPKGKGKTGDDDFDMGDNKPVTCDSKVVITAGVPAPVPPVAATVTFDLTHHHTIKPALPFIRLWRGLVVGDIVVMLEMGDGRYYVLERAAIEDGNSNEILNPKEEGMKGLEKQFEYEDTNWTPRD